MTSARAFDLVVFDWDGTLMDSVGAIVGCTRATWRELALQEPAEATIRDCIGLGLDDTFRRLRPEASQALRERLRLRYRHHWLATFAGRVAPFPSAEAALEQLAAADYLLAVATGKSRQGLERDLDRLGWAPRFAAWRTASDSPSKPSPHMLLALTEELGIRPERTLMVGDTSHDLRMAANAGTAAVGVLSGSHGVVEMSECGPMGCLADVGELPEWLADRTLASVSEAIATGGP